MGNGNGEPWFRGDYSNVCALGTCGRGRYRPWLDFAGFSESVGRACGFRHAFPHNSWVVDHVATLFDALADCQFRGFVLLADAVSRCI